jgi:hypothetical protein
MSSVGSKPLMFDVQGLKVRRVSLLVLFLMRRPRRFHQASLLSSIDNDSGALQVDYVALAVASRFSVVALFAVLRSSFHLDCITSVFDFLPCTGLAIASAIRLQVVSRT